MNNSKKVLLDTNDIIIKLCKDMWKSKSKVFIVLILKSLNTFAQFQSTENNDTQTTASITDT